MARRCISDRDERQQVIATMRETVGAEAQVLAGAVNRLDARDALHSAQLAAEAGADVALVLPPHHYRLAHGWLRRSARIIWRWPMPARCR